MSLTTRIEGGAPLDEIADYLDGLAHDERLAQVHTLGRRHQKALYETSSEAALDLDHFVPPGRTDPVPHHGINTLPLPRKQRLFEKRFARGEEGEVFGYNEGVFRKLIGPGYYVAVETHDEPKWRARGPVVIDYWRSPSSSPIDDWPKVVPNWWGLQAFVYLHTRDFMRRISEHVTVGAAYKYGVPLGSYFVLCRED